MIKNRNFPSNNSYFAEEEIPTYEISEELKDSLFERANIQDYNFTKFIYNNVKNNNMAVLYLKDPVYIMNIFIINTRFDSDNVENGYTYFLIVNTENDCIDIWEVFEDMCEFRKALI